MFVVITVVSGIVGAICAFIGGKQYVGTGKIVEGIRARMKEMPTGIQEQPPQLDLKNL